MVKPNKNAFEIIGGRTINAEVTARKNEHAWNFKDIPKKDPYSESFTDYLA